MFTHWLAGGMLMHLYVKSGILPIPTNYLYLCIFVGGLLGFLPDIASVIYKKTTIDKWSHLHRDDFSHSIFLPIIIFLTLSFFVRIKYSAALSFIILSHSIIDMYGIGWGVKLFFPLSWKTFKLFYKGKIIAIFQEDEIKEEVKKHGRDDWLKTIFFSFNPKDELFTWTIVEYGSLLAFISLFFIV
jgi:hypothetical protein